MVQREWSDIDIRSITCRKVLNSHIEFTNEFIVEPEDESISKDTSSPSLMTRHGQVQSSTSTGRILLDNTTLAFKYPFRAKSVLWLNQGIRLTRGEHATYFPQSPRQSKDGCQSLATGGAP